MAWIIPFQNTGTDVDLGSTDNLYVGQDIYFAAHARGSGSNQQIIIDGRAAGGEGPVFSLGGVGTVGNVVHIGATGQITSLGSALVPIVAIGVTGKSGRIVNEGIINATFNNGAGVATIATDAGAAFTITNSGTIRAGAIGVASGAITAGLTGTFTLINTGTIQGGSGETSYGGTGVLRWGSFVSFAQDGSNIVDPAIKDSITNSGTMIGNIWLGGGDDLYDGSLGRVTGEIHGGEGIDRIYAGAGDDRLFGENGDDLLQGGAGADYLHGGSGTDGAQYATAPSGVVASLANPASNTGHAAGDTYVSIENLSGSAYNDTLIGTTGANGLNGRDGDDRLIGNAGNDRLTGGLGKDTFVLTAPLNAATNVDTITDFSVVDDTIALENLYFTALTTTGTLSAAAFQANTSGLASDASDRIIYETDTGNLYYDPDGTGAAANILVARLGVGLSLTNADFTVI